MGPASCSSCSRSVGLSRADPAGWIHLRPPMIRNRRSISRPATPFDQIAGLFALTPFPVLVRNRARQGGTAARVDALALHVVQVAAMTLRELSDLVGLHDIELKSARAVCVVASMIGGV